MRLYKIKYRIPSIPVCLYRHLVYKYIIFFSLAILIKLHVNLWINMDRQLPAPLNSAKPFPVGRSWPVCAEQQINNVFCSHIYNSYSHIGSFLFSARGDRVYMFLRWKFLWIKHNIFHKIVCGFYTLIIPSKNPMLDG